MLYIVEKGFHPLFGGVLWTAEKTNYFFPIRRTPLFDEIFGGG
jgi:hypothetical protein